MPLPSYTDFINNHLFSAMEQDQDDYAELCAICQDPFSSPVETACGHLFCGVCARSWFSSKSTCPNCRRPLYDEFTRPRWIATVERFDFDGLEFNIDQDIVLQRLIELNPIFEDGDEADIDFDDIWVRLDYDSLLAVAVAAIAWGYGQLDEDYQLEAEDLYRFQWLYYTAAKDVQEALWPLRGQFVMSMNLWSHLRAAVIVEDSEHEDSEDEDEEDQDFEAADDDGAGDEDDDEDYNGLLPAETARANLNTELQNMVSYLCQYATIHHRVFH